MTTPPSASSRRCGARATCRRAAPRRSTASFPACRWKAGACSISAAARAASRCIWSRRHGAAHATGFDVEEPVIEAARAPRRQARPLASRPLRPGAARAAALRRRLLRRRLLQGRAAARARQGRAVRRDLPRARAGRRLRGVELDDRPRRRAVGRHEGLCRGRGPVLLHGVAGALSAGHGARRLPRHRDRSTAIPGIARSRAANSPASRGRSTRRWRRSSERPTSTRTSAPGKPCRRCLTAASTVPLICAGGSPPTKSGSWQCMDRLSP